MLFSYMEKRKIRCANQALIVSSFDAPYRQQAQALAGRLAKRADFAAYLWHSRSPVRHGGESVPLLGWMLMDEYAPASGDTVAQTMLHCLYSCHANGYIRERHLRALAQSAYSDMAMPFVVQAFGNWVHEISIAAFDLLMAQPKAFARFVAANPTAWHMAQSRAASYWDL